MQLSPIIQEIADATGLSAKVNEGDIKRKINTVLEILDYLVEWRFTSTPFSESISSGDSSAMVGFMPFRPIYCEYADSSGNTGKLDFVQLSDFKRENAKYGTTPVTTRPRYYSLGGRYIYVGYGILNTDITVSGLIRRKLALGDIDMLPSLLVISRTVMLISKAGSPEYIMARADYKDIRDTVKSMYKPTAEKRSRHQLSRQVYNNWHHLRSLS